jgi:hypothetical protein
VGFRHCKKKKKKSWMALNPKPILHILLLGFNLILFSRSGRVWNLGNFLLLLQEGSCERKEGDSHQPLATHPPTIAACWRWFEVDNWPP